MNILSSVQSVTRYAPTPITPFPPPLPTSFIYLNFNSFTGNGTSGGNITNSGSDTGNVAQYKNFFITGNSFTSGAGNVITGNSLVMVTSPAAAYTGCFYPGGAPSASGNLYLSPFATGFTVAFWFKVNSTTNTYPCLFCYGVGSQRLIVGFQIDGTVNTLYVNAPNVNIRLNVKYVGGSSVSPYLINTPYNYVEGSMNHLGWSISPNGSQIITINGQQWNTSVKVSGTVANNAKFYIGVETNPALAPYINGNVDEFYLFKTALSLTQLQALYYFP